MLGRWTTTVSSCVPPSSTSAVQTRSGPSGTPLSSTAGWRSSTSRAGSFDSLWNMMLLGLERRIVSSAKLPSKPGTSAVSAPFSSVSSAARLDLAATVWLAFSSASVSSAVQWFSSASAPVVWCSSISRSPFRPATAPPVISATRTIEMTPVMVARETPRLALTNVPTATTRVARTENATTVAVAVGSPSMTRLKEYTTTAAVIAAATGSSSGSAIRSRTSALWACSPDARSLQPCTSHSSAPATTAIRPSAKNVRLVTRPSVMVVAPNATSNGHRLGRAVACAAAADSKPA